MTDALAIVFVFFVALVALDLLAMRFGADSRDHAVRRRDWW